MCRPPYGQYLNAAIRRVSKQTIYKDSKTSYAPAFAMTSLGAASTPFVMITVGICESASRFNVQPRMETEA